MAFSDAIKEVYRRAAQEQLKYPQLAALLLAAGVKRYVVDVATGTTTYYGIDEERHAGRLHQTIAASFLRDELIAALRMTQQGKTDYAQFLRDIAAAGVQGYLADLEHGQVVYLGHGEGYAETIPGL